MYSEEAEAFRKIGFSISTHSATENPGTAYLEEKETVLYRGWMLKKEDYRTFESLVLQKNARLFTSSSSYLATHHLPNWYDRLSLYTPETVAIADLETAENVLESLAWNKYFIKDFVKSVKTSIGSVITDSHELPKIIDEMMRLRGEIEGGLCIRRFEEFIPHTEFRYFAIEGEPFSPNRQPCPEPVWFAAKRIQSPFFSIDIAQRTDGVLRIVEIGDGQVSDRTGWSCDRFVEVLSQKLLK
ncbi:ATP-grasp domain-containing protein [Geitlerinema sp. CS-897]|nr:ATP-grasp domain-containing protein [Geitlerinema sp. CS-897]